MANVRVLRNYRWVDKNPVIDIVRTAIADEGLSDQLKKVADLAGLTYSTIDGWINGDIRDPRHSSIMTTLIGLGYENTWKKARKLNIEQELEFARAWLKKERERRERERAKAKTPRKRKTKQAAPRKKRGAVA